MRFQNREHAARQLADRLESLRGEEPLVVAIPPAPIPMARLIADTIDADLDVMLVGTLRASSDSPIIGVIDESGTVLRGRHYEDAAAAGWRSQLETIRAQRKVYTQSHPPAVPAGRTAILVDDGHASAMALVAAVRSLRMRGARRIVVAVAVASRSTVEMLRRETDDVVVLHSFDEPSTVNDFFRDFGEPTTQQVTAALHYRRRWSRAA